MNVYLVIILAALFVSFVLDVLVGALTAKSLTTTLPPEFADAYPPEKYQRSQEYTRSKIGIGLVESALGLTVLLACIFSGAFALWDDVVLSLGLGPVGAGLVFFAGVGVAADILGKPFSIYRTFVLEERFGFNKTTPGLYIMDTLKGYALAIILGASVLAGVLYFFQELGGLAWLVAWGAVTVFMLLVQYLAPTFILPLFNKFTPLEEGELKQSIESYAKENGFTLSGLFVMDGSKRSTKANAFFTGFGKRKRIALFDTLIKNHTVGELTTVLAHEVGHYKKGHTKKMLLMSVGKTGLLFFILSLFLSHAGLYEAFGMDRQPIYAGLMFFGFLYAPVSMIFSVLANVVSRKFEYEADEWAVRTTGDKEEFINALKKLTVENLGNLTPHRLDVFLHYSHPPILARIRAIESL